MKTSKNTEGERSADLCESPEAEVLLLVSGENEDRDEEESTEERNEGHILSLSVSVCVAL